MRNKIKTSKLLKSWKSFINESIVFDETEYDSREDYVESGFKDESYENMKKIGSSELKGYFSGYDEEKLKSLTQVDNETGINSKIKEIINEIEKKVQHSREVLNDPTIKGKIYFYESADEGFIKYNFDDLSPEDRINSTLEFESTDHDWVGGYGLGAYRHTLTHFSSPRVSALLFEILIEFVSIVRDKSIIPDRVSITSNAQKKWTVYYNRPDIETLQLDLHDDDAEETGYDKLTPDDPSDDAIQTFSIEKEGENWHKSIFSKAFKKKNMDTLKYIANKSEFLEINFNIINADELRSKL